MAEAESKQEVSEDERCGRCGASVTASMELCPECGGLLAAYRAAETVATPPSLFPARTDTVIEAPQLEPETDLRPNERALDPATAASEELQTARAVLIAALSAHGRRLTSVARVHISESRDSSAPSNAPTPVRPAPRRPPLARPAARVDVNSYPLKPARVPRGKRPGRPGLVTTSPVEPALLIGAVLLAIAVGLVVCASLTSLRLVAFAAFLSGALGIFALVIAVLAVLIQRDRRRP